MLLYRKYLGGIFMTIYKLVYDDGADYEPCRGDMAYFSTREKAEELLSQFQKYDFMDSYAYGIEECEVDIIPEYTLKELKNHKEYYEEYYNNGYEEP
jgi:hypothetical protein